MKAVTPPMDDLSLSLTPRLATPAPLPPAPPVPKSAGLAFLFSLLMPGTGQIYCGKTKRGLWTLGFFLGCVIGFFWLAPELRTNPSEFNSLFSGLFFRTAIVLYAFGFLDAFLTAREVSSGESLAEYNPRVAAVLNLTTRGFGYFYLGQSKLAIGVFVFLGVFAAVAMGTGVAALQVVGEMFLIGFAIHGYRLARRLNAASGVAEAPRAHRGSDLPAILAYGLASVIAVGYFALMAVGVAAPNYRIIDQSETKLHMHDGQTFYDNPKYGVTLHLPGAWLPHQAAANQFCHLYNRDDAAEAVFLLPNRTLDGYTGELRRVLRSDPQFEVDAYETLEVRGSAARRLVYRRINAEGVALRRAMLVVKKGLSAYVVMVTALQPEEESWKRLVNRLPQSLELN